MKLYSITLDDFSKEIVLTALMEQAHRLKGAARENYLTVYGDIKESVKNQ